MSARRVPEVLPAADAADLRPQHVYLDTSSGHRLRITRWAPGARRRDVHRVMPDGALVELGYVTDTGGHAMLAVPNPAAGANLPTRGCDTFVGGARILDTMLEVGTLQVYTVKVRTDKEGD